MSRVRIGGSKHVGSGTKRTRRCYLQNGGESCSAVDQIAVDGQFADERVDLAQRQRRGGVTVQVAFQEAVGGHAEFERAGGGVLDDGGTVLLDEGEDAEDAADADGALMAVDVVADGGDGRTGALGGGEQGESLRWDAGGPVVVGDAMPAPLGAQVLTQQLAGARVEEADVDVVPLHVDAASSGNGPSAGRSSSNMAATRRLVVP